VHLIFQSEFWFVFNAKIWGGKFGPPPPPQKAHDRTHENNFQSECRRGFIHVDCSIRMNET
jgi:hypothetical protein